MFDEWCCGYWAGRVWAGIIWQIPEDQLKFLKSFILLTIKTDKKLLVVKRNRIINKNPAAPQVLNAAAKWPKNAKDFLCWYCVFIKEMRGHSMYYKSNHFMLDVQCQRDELRVDRNNPRFVPFLMNLIQKMKTFRNTQINKSGEHRRRSGDNKNRQFYPITTKSVADWTLKCFMSNTFHPIK